MADISQIKIGGQTYDIKDRVAREASASGVYYAGETSTPISDGMKTMTGQVTVGGEEKSLKSGALVIYEEKEFIYLQYDEPDESSNVGEFNEFGSTGSLKGLAFKDSATGTTAGHTHSVTGTGNVSGTSVESHSYTPEGTVAVSGSATSTFTGTEQEINLTGDTEEVTEGDHTYTPAGTIDEYTPAGIVSAPTFSGTAENHGHTISTGSGSANYTPAGTVSTSISGGAHQHNVTASAKWGANGAPYKASVSGELLTLEETSAAPVISASSEEASPVCTASSSFTGTGVELVLSETSITPKGTVSAPKFTGNAANLTFTGTQATLKHAAHKHTINLTTNYTPAGTINTVLNGLSGTFTGKAASLTHVVTQGTVSIVGTAATATDTVTVS